MFLGNANKYLESKSSSYLQLTLRSARENFVPDENVPNLDCGCGYNGYMDAYICQRSSNLNAGISLFGTIPP